MTYVRKPKLNTKLVTKPIIQIILSLTTFITASAQSDLGFGFGFGGSQAEADVRLLIDHSHARDGDVVNLGVVIDLPPERYTYWRNPGSAGFPPSIIWEIPKGTEVDEIQWPIPQKYYSSNHYSYINNNQVVLMTTLRIRKVLSFEKIKVKAIVNWPECTQKACYLGKSEVSATLIVGEKKQHISLAKLFEKWQSRIPIQAPILNISARCAEISKDGLTQSIRFTVSVVDSKSEVDFFPFESNNSNYTVDPATSRAFSNKTATLTKKITVKKKQAPEKIFGILVRDGKGQHAVLQLRPAEPPQ